MRPASGVAVVQEPAARGGDRPRRGRRVVVRFLVLAAVLLAGVLVGASVVRWKAPRVRTYAVALPHGASPEPRHDRRRHDDGPAAKAAVGVYLEPCACTDPGTVATSAERATHRCPVVAPTNDQAARDNLQTCFAEEKDGRPHPLRSALERKGHLEGRQRISGDRGNANASSASGRRPALILQTSSRATAALPGIPGLSTRRGYLSEEEQLAIVADLNSQGGFVGYFGKSCQEYGFNFSFYIAKPTAVAIPATVRALAERMMHDGFLSREFPPNFVLVNRYGPGEGIHPHVDDAFYRGPIASVTLGAPGVLSFTMDEYGTFFHPPVGRKDIASGKTVTGELRAAREGQLKQRRAALPKCLAGTFPPGSFFAMTDEARYGWKHEMPRRTSDSIPFALSGETPRVEGHEVGASAADLDGGGGCLVVPAPGQSLRTIVDREQRLSLTFRHVRKEVVEARWAGKTFSSTAYA